MYEYVVCILYILCTVIKIMLYSLKKNIWNQSRTITLLKVHTFKNEPQNS